MSETIRKLAMPALILILFFLIAFAARTLSIRSNEAHEGFSAIANVIGGPLARDLEGVVEFFDRGAGTLVSVRVQGLPRYMQGDTPIGPHGFHIHEHGSCEVGDESDPFLAAGSHFNPTEQPHGNHIGDFPVLFSNDGIAVMRFFTDKFKVDEVVGKTIIIHKNPDDYRSQPTGNAGPRLGCGLIEDLEGAVG